MPILNPRKLSALALATVMTASLAILIPSPVGAKHKSDAPTATESTGSVTWSTNLPQALKKAKSSQKYVLIDIYTDWCGWCKRLDQSTYPDPAVGELLNKSFICVKVNAEKGSGSAIKTKYGATGFPYIVILNPDGSVRGQIGGYEDAPAFCANLNQIIQQPSTN